ncbi:MAG: glycine cleavage system aminomethyltransferase GcvT [Acidimicrobiaceae bacterium]|nr:glycine cleavage system aminomethyltransferase GcvT [Acidimicrobiaceae bacterium]
MTKRTPLYELHLELGAKMVPFGGWEMPLSYPDGTVSEHLDCRSKAVAFDVSHLGTLEFDGSDTFSYLQDQLSNDLAKIAAGRTQYTHLLDEQDASIVDDLIVWWVDEDRFHVLPNAANTDVVQEVLGGKNSTEGRALIAVQGPLARELASTFVPEAAGVGKFRVIEFSYRGKTCFAAGTGYTGEDGFECYVPAELSTLFFKDLLQAGVVPAGLGARDTLRLEAGLPLHGHELKKGVSPPEANLDWVVGYSKPDFRGKTAVESRKERGLRYRLFGVRSTGRQPLREGASVYLQGRAIGQLTSGNFSPLLKCGIGFALLEPAMALDVEVEVDMRGRRVPAVTTTYPFYKSSK